MNAKNVRGNYSKFLLSGTRRRAGLCLPCALHCHPLRPVSCACVLCFMQLCIAAGAPGLFRLPRARQPNQRRRTALDTNSAKHCRRLDPTRTPTTHTVAPPVVQPLSPARSWTTQAVRSQTESQYSSSNSNSGLLSRISTGLNFYQPS